MSVNDRKVFVMALMLVALMSTFVSVASAAPGTQTWYPHGAGGTSADLTKSAPATVSNTIADGVWREWVAVPAECDLTMGAGTWVLHLNYYAPCGGDIGVKVLKKEGQVYLNHKYSVPLTSGVNPATLNVNLDEDNNDVDFTTGQHLSMQIGWWANAPCTDSLTVYCGSGKTTISSPSSDPGYPVPELSTLALFSVGLLALVGYVVYRRRQI